MKIIATMRRKFSHTSTTILIFFFALPCVIGWSALNTMTLTTWLTYWKLPGSVALLKEHFGNTFDAINPFFYAFDENGAIINACKDKDAATKTLNTLFFLPSEIIPTITNDIIGPRQTKIKDPAIVHRLLSSAVSRQRHIEEIIGLIEELDASGVDIDYEDIDAHDRDLFSLFIEELAQALRKQNKKLYVTVQQKTKDHRRSGAGAVDWQAIARHADRIIIMCYNYSSRLGKPGPLCPPHWLKDIISFARTQIPKEKICIALPLHGYDWSAKKANSVNFKSAQALITAHKATLNWDWYSASPNFHYTENGVRHEVWFENPESLNEKIKILKRAGILHVAIWHLGLLDPAFLPSLENIIY